MINYSKWLGNIKSPSEIPDVMSKTSASPSPNITITEQQPITATKAAVCFEKMERVVSRLVFSGRKSPKYLGLTEIFHS